MVLNEVRDKGAQKAVWQRKVDMALWATVQHACFLPLCGALRNFGQHKEQPIGKFKIQCVKMMERLAQKAHLKDALTLPKTNVLELAASLMGEWNAEKQRIVAKKQKEAQLQ